MAKERGQCLHYINEGNCDLGKECEFWGHCQTCPTWKRKPGAKNPKPDLRKQREARRMKKERFEY